MQQLIPIFFLCICSFFVLPLWAETLALYSTWYTDPTTTIAIHWHTPLGQEDDKISVQMPSGQWTESEGSHTVVGSRIVHTVLLEELSPDTEYLFHIISDPANYRFRTAPLDLEKPLCFVIGGDAFAIGQAAFPIRRLFREMNRAITAVNPLFVVIGGDIAYALGNPIQTPTIARERWFSFLTEWKNQMTLTDGRIIPFIPVAGNHDISPEHSDLFFSLFAFPENQLYRNLDFGRYLTLILLDSGNLDPIENAQTIWLAQILEQKKNTPYQIPIYHQGAYPSFYPYDESTSTKIRTHWCPLFDQYNISCAFEHHNHALKRTYPLRNQKIDPSGVIYLGDGSWGVPPRNIEPRWYIEKEAKVNSVYLLTITPQSMQIKAIGLKGQTFDQLEIQPMSCCFDGEELLQKAQAYAKNDERLLNYIIAILNNENFQSNPQGYLNAWSKKRGYTREYRIPEDQARSFFDQHFQ